MRRYSSQLRCYSCVVEGASQQLTHQDDIPTQGLISTKCILFTNKFEILDSLLILFCKSSASLLERTATIWGCHAMNGIFVITLVMNVMNEAKQ